MKLGRLVNGVGEKWSAIWPLFLSVRARIFFWYLLLLSGFLIASIPLMMHWVTSEINQRVQEDLDEEVKIFSRFLSNDLEARTRLGIRDTVLEYPESPSDLVNIFNLYLSRRIPEDDTFLIAIIDNDFYRASPEALPISLNPQSKLMKQFAISSVRRQGIATQPNSSTGDIIYVAIPIQNEAGQILGRFVIAHASAGEHQEALATLRIVFLTLGIVFALSILISALMAGKVLLPLKSILAAATSINESNLTQRIPINTQGELAELAEALNSMMDRLESAFQGQQQLVNDAGHELRTPITIMQGHLELMNMEAMPLEEQQTVELVLDEMDRMGRLVNDLILLAKSERPDFLRLQPIELDPFFADFFSNMKALTSSPRNWQRVGTVSGSLQGDRQRLIQALLNLAYNAVQYTKPDDTIILGTRQTRQSLQIWIEDSGEGIAPSDQARIFERFARGKKVHSQTEGSGLGLAIVKQIVEAHCGSVVVQSQLGVGSKFIITLSLKKRGQWGHQKIA